MATDPNLIKGKAIKFKSIDPNGYPVDIGGLEFTMRHDPKQGGILLTFDYTEAFKKESNPPSGKTEMHRKTELLLQKLEKNSDVQLIQVPEGEGYIPTKPVKNKNDHLGEVLLKPKARSEVGDLFASLITKFCDEGAVTAEAPSTSQALDSADRARELLKGYFKKPPPSPGR